MAVMCMILWFNDKDYILYRTVLWEIMILCLHAFIQWHCVILTKPLVDENRCLIFIVWSSRGVPSTSMPVEGFCRKFVDHMDGSYRRWQMMVMVCHISLLEKISSTSTYPASVPVQRLWVLHFLLLPNEYMLKLYSSLTVCFHRTLTASAATLSRPCLTFLISSSWTRKLSTELFFSLHT